MKHGVFKIIVCMLIGLLQVIAVIIFSDLTMALYKYFTEIPYTRGFGFYGLFYLFTKMIFGFFFANTIFMVVKQKKIMWSIVILIYVITILLHWIQSLDYYPYKGVMMLIILTPIYFSGLLLINKLKHKIKR